MLEQVSPGCFSALMRLLWRAYVPWVRRLSQVGMPKKDACQHAAVVADEMGHQGIWTVEASVELLAHIACWHSLRETYRGYLLCSDSAGRTFLLDLHTYSFVEAAKTLLVQIVSIEQAKHFIDVLLERSGEAGGQEVATR